MKTIYGSQENWKAVENEFEESSDTINLWMPKSIERIGCEDKSDLY